MLDLLPSWLIWAELECTVHAVLSKRSINQFSKRQQTIRAYCPNIYILWFKANIDEDWILVIIFVIGTALILAFLIYFLLYLFKNYKNQPQGPPMTRLINSFRTVSGARPSWLKRSNDFGGTRSSALKSYSDTTGDIFTLKPSLSSPSINFLKVSRQTIWQLIFVLFYEFSRWFFKHSAILAFFILFWF